MSKPFHLSDVLSITTGIALSTTGEYPIDGVYKLLNFMSGESLYTHQLPRVCAEAAPILLRQHPQLAEADASGVTPENCRAWLAEKIMKYGEWFDVTPMTRDDHEYREPLSELAERVHPSRIFVVNAGGE